MTVAQKYSFKIERKRLLEFSKMPIAARLKWLEEALLFTAGINNGKILKNWLNLPSRSHPS